MSSLNTSNKKYYFQKEMQIRVVTPLVSPHSPSILQKLNKWCNASMATVFILIQNKRHQIGFCIRYKSPWRRLASCPRIEEPGYQARIHQHSSHGSFQLAYGKRWSQVKILGSRWLHCPQEHIQIQSQSYPLETGHRGIQQVTCLNLFLSTELLLDTIQHIQKKKKIVSEGKS